MKKILSNLEGSMAKMKKTLAKLRLRFPEMFKKAMKLAKKEQRDKKDKKDVLLSKSKEEKNKKKGGGNRMLDEDA